MCNYSITQLIKEGYDDASKQLRDQGQILCACVTVNPAFASSLEEDATYLCGVSKNQFY